METRAETYGMNLNDNLIKSIRYGMLFIIAGVLIYASQQHLLRDWFWWFVAGWGLLLLCEGGIRTSVTHSIKPAVSLFIWGALLTGFSLHQLYRFEEWWPMILIVVGLVIVVNSLENQDSKTVST